MVFGADRLIDGLDAGGERLIFGVFPLLAVEFLPLVG